MLADERFSPRKRPRQRRAQVTVEAILRAAAQVLEQEGYEAANTNRVAEIAGVSVGSLYQYFPNKEALVAALIDEHVDHQMQLLVQTLAELRDESLECVVRRFVCAMLDAHRLEPRLHRVLCEQIPRLAGYERIAEFNKQAQALVHAYFSHHQARFRRLDLDVAAFLVVRSVEASTHAAVIEEPDLLHHPAFAEEIAQLVLRYLLKDPVSDAGARPGETRS
jgi:AcrR family transcriptional regulator